MSSVVPDVSVLMGVHNAEATLEATLDSVLDQRDVSFEFIVVDDGSTDASGSILDRRAAIDARLVVIHQPNAGLTAALRRGSELARGRFIARQDAGGDRSLPGRLAIQARLLSDHEGAVFATCGHRYIDIDGRFLCDVVPDADAVERGLTTLRVPGVSGILHASSMFRTDVFHAVGGYREAFRVAQDIDLWLRLHERGRCVVTPEVLYDCRFELGGISGRRRMLQAAFAELAVRCAQARRDGRREPALEIAEQPAHEGVAAQRANYHYFVASCLRRREPAVARSHYLAAWRADPFRLKALIGAACTW